ncbi:MAG: response regulator, partial [Pseudomonadota bacterium]|nr:response regulator [Pseudomonadota bacterium]
LLDLGYEAIMASSGPEALKVLESDVKVDLLFTDIVMPGGYNGVQLYAAAVERRPGLPVLYTSGYAHSVVQEIELISDKLLSKPYVQSTLAEMVHKALHTSTQERKS